MSIDEMLDVRRLVLQSPSMMVKVLNLHCDSGGPHTRVSFVLVRQRKR